MKATIEFNLPEEQIEHLAAVHAMDWKLALWSFREFLMNVNKHEIPTTTEQIFDHLLDDLESRGLSLDD